MKRSGWRRTPWPGMAAGRHTPARSETRDECAPVRAPQAAPTARLSDQAPGSIHPRSATQERPAGLASAGGGRRRAGAETLPMIGRSSSVCSSSSQRLRCPPPPPLSQRACARDSLPFAAARPGSIVLGFPFQVRCLNDGNHDQEGVRSTVCHEFSLAVRRTPLPSDLLLDLRITRRGASALQFVPASFMLDLRLEHGSPTRSPRPRPRRPTAAGLGRIA